MSEYSNNRKKYLKSINMSNEGIGRQMERESEKSAVVNCDVCHKPFGAVGLHCAYCSSCIKTRGISLEKVKKVRVGFRTDYYYVYLCNRCATT